jgi:hypothetical protein
MSLLLRALTVWVALAFAEIVQGYLRVRLLNRRVGDRRARQIGVVTGSLLIFAITWATLPWMGVRTEWEALGVGALWLGLMVAFDVGFGRWVFRSSWERIWEEFDLTRGRWLSIGMAVAFAAPWTVFRLR